MKPKLPRALLWTDKTSMDDFLRESINMELYNYYMMQANGTLYSHRYSPLRLFNEIYYQLTKIEYESNYDVNFKELTQDIKANLGLLQNGVLVLKMMHIFLYLIDKKTRTLAFFEKNLRAYIASFKNSESAFIFEQGQKHSFTTHLHPHPCAVKDLNGMLLPWDDITNDFNRESIEEILKLWPLKEDKNEVLHMIEDAYMKRRRLVVRNKDLTAYTPLMADYDFFSDLYNRIGYKEEPSFRVAEAQPSDKRSYAEQEEVIYNLKKKIAHLESEIERLSSERNNLKQKKNRDRAFTLKMMVDYCKKHLNLDKAAVIVAMLNKFLRDARDYTQEECDLVDSVEIEYLNKKYGNTFNNANVTMQNPQIQDVYRITGNDTVNLGDQQDGEEGEEDPDEEES